MVVGIGTASDKFVRVSARFYVAFGATVGLYFLNVFVPVLRFTDPGLNWRSFVLIYGVSVSMAILGSFGRRHLGWWGVGFPALAALLLTPLAAIAVATMPPIRGVDRSFMPLQVVAACGTRVVVYRTDGGATTDYGIVLRQEKDVLPGVAVVRVLYSRYHMSEATVRGAGNCAVSVQTQYAEPILMFKVKRAVYF